MVEILFFLLALFYQGCLILSFYPGLGPAVTQKRLQAEFKGGSLSEVWRTTLLIDRGGQEIEDKSNRFQIFKIGISLIIDNLY